MNDTNKSNLNLLIQHTREINPFRILQEANKETNLK